MKEHKNCRGLIKLNIVYIFLRVIFRCELQGIQLIVLDLLKPVIHIACHLFAFGFTIQFFLFFSFHVFLIWQELLVIGQRKQKLLGRFVLTVLQNHTT